MSLVFNKVNAMKRFLVIVTLAGLIAVPAHADITIGMAVSEASGKSLGGDAAARGAQQAIDDINAQGGVNNEKLVLQKADDNCNSRQAVNVANQFIASGVKFVVGAGCSSAAVPAARIYSQQKMLMISALSSDPALTEAGYKTIFRVSGRDDQQGVAQANYILNHFRDYRMAILHDKSVVGQAQAEAFQKTINSYGVKEAVFDAYTPHQKDYSNLIRNFVNVNGIQLLVVEGSATDVAHIAREIKKQQATILVIGNDTLATDEFWKLAVNAGDGVMMTSMADTRDLPEAQVAVAGLRKANVEPAGYSLYGYAAVQVLAHGIKRAGYPDPAKVAMALRKNTFDTVIGKIGFDEKGDVTGSGYAVYRWHDGKYGQIGNQ